MDKTKSVGASDMIRTARGTVVDSDTLLKQVQTRIWTMLTGKSPYAGLPDDSDKFLRKNVFKKFNMLVLYVDLVGSTQLALGLSVDKLAKIMNAFAQEMANAIAAHGGLVLKVMGDGVIGYFVKDDRSFLTADHAVSCAKSMLHVIQRGINPILSQYGYPELQIRVGLDYGANIAVMYGNDKDASYVDLMGRSMNMASKVQSVARPDQILIGQHVYEMLHPVTQKDFEEISLGDVVWKYRALDTGNLYKVYAHANRGDAAQ